MGVLQKTDLIAGLLSALSKRISNNVFLKYLYYKQVDIVNN